MTGTRTTLRRSWSALALVAFAAIFLLTVGTIQTKARGSVRSETAARPELASVAWLAGEPSQRPAGAPFPILTLVGGGFAVMTFAFQRAARRFAQ